jgi:hypothetical protein
MIKAKFKSRYGDLRTVTEIATNTYRIEGKSGFTRGGGDAGYQMFDFEGGPFIETGMPLSLLIDNANGTVEQITPMPTGKEGYAAVEIVAK